MNATETNPQDTSGTETGPETSSHPHPHPLCRPFHDRMLAGVAAGIAQYLGVDVIVVRVALAVLALVGGAGIPIYLAGWLLIPEEGADQSIANDLIQSISARSH
jgi:phage shock protein PspC (stress-responsive transcriptional regulator)